jgi:hypothetical protein
LVLKIMAFFIELIAGILKLTHSERIDTSPISEVPIGKISWFWTREMNSNPLK